MDIVTRNRHVSKSFPGICFVLVRPVADLQASLDYLTDLTLIDPSSTDENVMTYFDTYRGSLRDWYRTATVSKYPNMMVKV